VQHRGDELEVGLLDLIRLVPERLVALVAVDELAFGVDAHGGADRELVQWCRLAGDKDALREGKPTQQLYVVEMRTMNVRKVASLTQSIIYSRKHCCRRWLERCGTLPSSRRRPSDARAQRRVSFLPGCIFPTASFHASAFFFHASTLTDKGEKSSLALRRTVFDAPCFSLALPRLT
jgi:hypothetical protein